MLGALKHRGRRTARGGQHRPAVDAPPQHIQHAARQRSHARLHGRTRGRQVRLGGLSALLQAGRPADDPHLTSKAFNAHTPAFPTRQRHAHLPEAAPDASKDRCVGQRQLHRNHAQHIRIGRHLRNTTTAKTEPRSRQVIELPGAAIAGPALPCPALDQPRPACPARPFFCNSLTRRCSHLRRGCQSSGKRWMSPRRRKLSMPSAGDASASTNVSRPTLPCRPVKWCLPFRFCGEVGR